MDVSQLQRPIETSVRGLGQAVKLLETATDEVKNYISSECNIIYECRVCQSLFRSIANFVLHKRQFCSNLVQNESSNNNDVNNVKNVEVKKGKKSLEMVVSNLQAKQSSEEIYIETMNEEKTDDNKKIISDKPIVDSVDNSRFAKVNIVYQNLLNKQHESYDRDFDNSQIVNSGEAILDGDGKTIQEEVLSPQYECHFCKQKFAHKKALKCHFKYKHNNQKRMYKCPENGCKDVFLNSWSVLKHLYKVHKKNSQQVKKLRNKIQMLSVVQSEMKEDVPKKLEVKEENEDLDAQWLNEFENSLKMCVRCGKRFERRAAMNSHLLLCLKKNDSNVIDENKNNVDNNIYENGRNGNKRKEDTIITISKKQKLVSPVKSERSSDDVLCISDEEPGITLESKADKYVQLNEIKCIPCRLIFKTRIALLKHMSHHFRWYHWKCEAPDCGFMSYDHSGCYRHVRKDHPDIPDKDQLVTEIAMETTRSFSTDFQDIPKEDDEAKLKPPPPPTSTTSSHLSDNEEISNDSSRDSSRDAGSDKVIMEVIFGDQHRPVRQRTVPKKYENFYKGKELSLAVREQPIKMFIRRKLVDGDSS